jgi:hypothetical protein
MQTETTENFSSKFTLNVCPFQKVGSMQAPGPHLVSGFARTTPNEVGRLIRPS